MAKQGLEINVCAPVRGWNGNPLIDYTLAQCEKCGWMDRIAQPDKCPVCGSPVSGGERLPAEQQPTIGALLLRILAVYKPEDRPEMILWVQHAGFNITQCITKGEIYVAASLAQGILKSAWRRAVQIADQINLSPLALGQIGSALGIEPPSGGESTVGLEPRSVEEEEDSA